MVIVALVAASPERSLGWQSEVGNSIRTEMIRASATAKAVFANSRGSGQFRNKSKSSEIQGVFEFALNGESKKLLLDNQNVVYCVTSNASFLLRRKSSSAPYSIASLGNANYIGKIVGGLLERYLFAPFSVSGVPVSEMFSDPTFRITKVTEVQKDQFCLLKIDYSYKSKEHDLGPGWILVSPQQGWVMRAYECEFSDRKPGRRLSCTIEYDGEKGEIPIPRRVVETYHIENERRNSYEFKTISFNSVDPDEFTLSYFGVPDITKVGKDWSVANTAYYFFGLAATFLAISLYLRRLANRS